MIYIPRTWSPRREPRDPREKRLQSEIPVLLVLDITPFLEADMERLEHSRYLLYVDCSDANHSILPVIYNQALHL